MICELRPFGRPAVARAGEAHILLALVGCVLLWSAIAAGIATGLSVPDAVGRAKEIVAHGIAGAIENATGVRSLLHPAARCSPHGPCLGGPDLQGTRLSLSRWICLVRTGALN